MSHFVFVRHGESQLNVLNRQARVFCGQTDTPLTERGRQQAREVGKMLAARADLRITAAVSSTLSRCRETLDLIVAELLYPVERLADVSGLNERSLGIFEGHPSDDVYREHAQYRDDPDFNQFDNHFTQRAPGGENLRDVTERAWPVIEKLDRACVGDVLIVSHYTTIRCVLGHGLELPQDAVQRMRILHAKPIVAERGIRLRLVDGLEVLDL